MNLDIIIPCLNEEKNLETLIPYLNKSTSKDRINIIVVDASESDDHSQLVCEKYEVNYLRSNISQRSIQMNTGVQHSSADAILFLHADVRPPLDFYFQISKAFESGYLCGCFAYKFDSNRIMLKINAYFTQYNGFFTGGGDQSLFIGRDTFNTLGGFCPNHVIMEDFDIYKRIKSKGIKYKIVKSKATISARKYQKYSWFRVNLINLIALMQYKVDRDSQSIRSFYNKWLNT